MKVKVSRTEIMEMWDEICDVHSNNSYYVNLEAEPVGILKTSINNSLRGKSATAGGYELALQLKEAGFPQGKGEWFYSAGGTRLPRFSSATFDGDVDAPTLEELIEACQPHFHDLKDRGEGHSYPRWAANTDDMANCEIEGTEGATPKIALVRLWLALNKK